MSTYEANRYAFPASAIASGTLADARIPNLATSKITSGTFADARLSSSSVTQHVDLSNLNASNLTSGTIPDARVGSSSVTQHVTAVTDARGSWSPSSNWHSFTYHQAKYVKAGRVCHISMRAQFSSSSGGGSGSGENAEFYFGGLPFTSWNGGNPVGGGTIQYTGDQNGQALVLANSNRIYILKDQDQYKDIGNYGADGGFVQRNYSRYAEFKSSASVRYIYMNLTYITAS